MTGQSIKGLDHEDAVGVELTGCAGALNVGDEREASSVSHWGNGVSI